MPTYDYRCRDCGHTIEIIHSILEDGPDACERCRGPLVRVLHPAGVIFKGSGFYVTDSRRSSGSSDSSSGSSDSSSGSSDSAAGSASDGGGGSKSSSKKTDAGGSAGTTGTGPPAPD